MVKKIGNFLFFLNLFFVSTIFSENTFKVNFKIFDLNNNVLKHVGVGIPFLVKLTIESNSANISHPNIKNLKDFNYTNGGITKRISNINGKVSILIDYLYEIRIDKEGTYILGPVYIDGEKIDNSLTIKVENEQKSMINQKKDVFLQISTDKDAPYINQEVHLIIKFYFKDSIELQNIEFPNLNNDFSIKKQQDMQEGNEEINGEKYSFKKFKCLIYPNKSGDLIVPSFKAHYEIPVNNNISFFSFVMSPMIENKQIFSNALKLSIKPLPTFKKGVNGVGNFRNFKASVNQNEAFIGEGVVLKLEIECDKCDIDNLKYNKINIDESIKYYDSKNYITTSDNSFRKKTFEFILQCEESKSFQIPQQTFIFFNPEIEKFEKLKTKPILINIKPFQEQKDQKSEMHLEEINPIYTNYASKNSEKSLNIKWLLFILSLPLLINIFYSLKFYLINNNQYKKFKNYKDTLKKINNAKIQNDSSQLYKIFINFFSKKFNINEANINCETTKIKLKEKKMESNLINEWEIYFLNIEKLTFYKNDIQIKKENLFNDALKWLNILNQQL